MGIAYIISAYQLPEQLARLVARLDAPGTWFLIHVDAITAADPHRAMTGALAGRSNVQFLERHPCRWGDFGHVRASIKGIRAIVQQELPVRCACLLTGQDYPVAGNRTIAGVLENAGGRSYIRCMPFPIHDPDPAVAAYLASLPETERRDREAAYRRLGAEPSRVAFWHVLAGKRHLRFPGRYFDRVIRIRRRMPGGLRPWWGRSYWSLDIEMVRYIADFVQAHPDFVSFFERVWIPDELFFQTIVMNSPLADTVLDRSLTWQRWREDDRRNYVQESDLDEIVASGALFARKFDVRVNARVLDLIDARLDAV